MLTLHLSSSSSLVYVEGEASINSFQDAEGQNRSNLNIVQRALLFSPYSIVTPEMRDY